MNHIMSFIVGVFWSFMGGVVGMIVVSAAYLFGIMPQTVLTMSLGFLVGFVPLILLTIWFSIIAPMQETAKEARLELVSQRTALQVSLQARAKAEADALSNSYKEIDDNVLSTTREIELLPQLHANINQILRSAERFYRDGAYSPFWSAIEEACRYVADYSQSIQRISRYAAQYPHLTARCVALGGKSINITSMPTLPSSNALECNITPAVNSLRELIYSAQRQPVFAIIWEQRRATATQIAGFQTVEQAVNGVSSTLSAALRNLDTSVTD